MTLSSYESPIPTFHDKVNARVEFASAVADAESVLLHIRGLNHVVPDIVTGPDGYSERASLVYWIAYRTGMTLAIDTLPDELFTTYLEDLILLGIDVNSRAWHKGFAKGLTDSRPG